MKCFTVYNLRKDDFIILKERESKKYNDKFYAIEVGSIGRGRKLEFVSLHPTCMSIIKSDEYGKTYITNAGVAKTKSGRYVIVPSKDNNSRALVKIYGDEGYRGSLEYNFSRKDIQIIATGYHAQGAAGRMGGGYEYLIIMEPGDSIDINRYGRLYGSNRKVRVEWDGKDLKVFDPESEPDLDEEIEEIL